MVILKWIQLLILKSFINQFVGMCCIGAHQSIVNFGNTSSASIPIALYNGIQSGKVKRGDRIMILGFGAVGGLMRRRRTMILA